MQCQDFEINCNNLLRHTFNDPFSTVNMITIVYFQFPTNPDGTRRSGDRKSFLVRSDAAVSAPLNECARYFVAGKHFILYRSFSAKYILNYFSLILFHFFKMCFFLISFFSSYVLNKNFRHSSISFFIEFM